MIQKIENKLGSLIYLLPVFWLGVVLATLNLTSPLVVGPTGILIIFCLFYCFAVTTFYVLFLLLNKLGEKFKKVIVPKKRMYLLSLIFALAPIFIVALNSLGQLGLMEMVLIASLVLLASFYASRKYEVSAE